MRSVYRAYRFAAHGAAAVQVCDATTQLPVVTEAGLKKLIGSAEIYFCVIANVKASAQPFYTRIASYKRIVELPLQTDWCKNQ